MRESNMSWARWLIRSALVASLCAAGCGGGESDFDGEPTASEVPAHVAAKLRVAVVDDEAIGEAVTRLRGEWSARSGGELEIVPATLAELVDGKLPAFDVVIFPSRHLGTLVERDELQPIRDAVLASAELALADIYPAIREGEMKYGGRTWALPLGSPPLMEGGLMVRLETKPPAWPLKGNAAAFTLLFHALGYIESPRRGEALFNTETMASRIADPPFVHALIALLPELSEAEARRKEPLVDFAGGIEMVTEGRAGWSLGWPSLAPEIPGEQDRIVSFALWPPYEEVYVASSGQWQNQSGGEPVTILGVEGRLMGVGRTTRNAVSAMKLCQWLAAGSAAVRVSSRSAGTEWFRESQKSQSREWLTSGAGPSSTDVVSAALAVEAPWIVPRVPGVDEYLEALAEQVRRACAGEVEPAAALRAAADAWEAITERRGRKKQAAAYRRHLGIEEAE